MESPRQDLLVKNPLEDKKVCVLCALNLNLKHTVSFYVILFYAVIIYIYINMKFSDKYLFSFSICKQYLGEHCAPCVASVL